MDTERFRTALLDERKRIEGAIEYLHRETPGSLEDETEEVLGAPTITSATRPPGRSTARSTTRSRSTRSRCSRRSTPR